MAAKAVWTEHPVRPLGRSDSAGRGLVHPVDNMSPSNDPLHPELLNDLTAKTVEHKFDLKWLIREVVLSNTYQLSSRGTSGESLPQWFQYGRTRPLSAEELVESWRVATNYDQSAYAKSRVDRDCKDRYRPLGSGYIVRFFGKPSDGTGNFRRPSRTALPEQRAAGLTDRLGQRQPGRLTGDGRDGTLSPGRANLPVGP